MSGIEIVEEIMCDASTTLAKIYSVPADGMTIYQAIQIGKMTERMHKVLDKNIKYARTQYAVNAIKY